MVSCFGLRRLWSIESFNHAGQEGLGIDPECFGRFGDHGNQRECPGISGNLLQAHIHIISA